ncbi:uncharacterized protein SCHCODRAFT_02569576 [Schizophyllum commune H4-8]|nr:uncharacterized protein SCHCODRAFT_02569576 [Schizophyllum commune H4-8]KAI5896690.1 hypothetical protein SCHCODRAFT_02569576 [Schizophyllum commune H4-8]
MSTHSKRSRQVRASRSVILIAIQFKRTPRAQRLFSMKYAWMQAAEPLFFPWSPRPPCTGPTLTASRTAPCDSFPNALMSEQHDSHGAYIESGFLECIVNLRMWSADLATAPWESGDQATYAGAVSFRILREAQVIIMKQAMTVFGRLAQIMTVSLEVLRAVASGWPGGGTQYHLWHALSGFSLALAIDLGVLTLSMSPIASK